MGNEKIKRLKFAKKIARTHLTVHVEAEFVRKIRELAKAHQTTLSLVTEAILRDYFEGGE